MNVFSQVKCGFIRDMLEKINDVFLYTLLDQDRRKKLRREKEDECYWFIEVSNGKSRQSFAEKVRKERKCFCEDLERFCWNFGKRDSIEISEVHLHR